jgi:hypothetical protein
MSEKLVEFLHFCRNKRGDVLCYLEKGEKSLWLDATGYLDDGTIDEINYCPFCGYKVGEKCLKDF